MSRFVYSVWLLLALLLPWPASGQQPLPQEQVSSDSSQADFYTIYANSDPLDGQPEQTPTTIGPNESNQCIPPNPAWQLVAQEGNTCYWYAPFAKPLNDYVVPMSKMSWVESSGGTCGVNPFSDPNNPNGTAVCDQPAPENNPYEPPVLTVGTPGPDLYSENPHDPTRLVADYGQIIVMLGQGAPAQLSAEYGPHLQQDMTSCSKYANHGILSPGCCTELGQAANMNMEGTGPSRRQSKMFQAAARTDCTSQAPETPPAGGPNPPHFYQVGTQTPGQSCQPWSATEVICWEDPGGQPPIVYQSGPPQDQGECAATLAAENARHEKAMAEFRKELQDPDTSTIALMGRVTKEELRHVGCVAKLSPLQGSATDSQPKEPTSPYRGGAQVFKACVKVEVGNRWQRFNLTLPDDPSTILGRYSHVSPVPGEASYFYYAELVQHSDGSYWVTGVKETSGSKPHPVSVRVEFTGPCR